MDKGKNIHERFFQGIVDKVLESVGEGMENKELDLERLHPAMLTSIVCTNIIMNLFFNTAQAKDNIQRKNMLSTLLTEIVNMCMQSVDILVEKDEQIHH